MDKQAIFNKVVQHLRAQKSQAIDVLGCLYRTEDGKKCAIGCLIPDELYTPNIERLGVRSLPVAFLQKCIPGYSPDDEGLLARLQRVHDNPFTIDELEERLQRVAKDFYLKMPVKENDAQEPQVSFDNDNL